jgi:dipeptide transport system substrate-binding protein
VIFTFERMRNPKHPFNIAYPAEFPYFVAMGMNKNLSSIKKLDEDTVQFVLKNPYAPFLQNMAMEFASIYSAEYANQLLRQGKTAQIASKPIGTGPFILKSYVRRQQIRYVANKDYWDKSKDGQVKLDALLIPIIPEMGIHGKKMRAGECHLGNPPFNEIATFKKDPNFVVKERPGFRVGFIAYNTQKPALRKTAVRQALDMALDKERLAKVYLGTAKVATSFMPSNQWSFDPSLKNAPYDPVKAKQLLKKAGYPNGFSLKFFITLGTSPENQSLAEMIQSDWKKIGVKVELISFEPGEFWKHANKGEHDAMFLLLGGSSGDPDDWIIGLGCNVIGQGNFARWCYKPMDALITKGQRTTNKEARIKIYQQAQQLLKQELPMTPLLYFMDTSLRSKKVKVLSTPFSQFTLGSQQFTGMTLEE